MRKKIALASAAALAASSVAQAAAAQPPVEPAQERVEGSELRSPYAIVGGVAAVLLLVLLLLTVLDNDTNAVPLSP